jgi:hypothetical protein
MDELERQVDAATQPFEQLLRARAVVITTRLPDYDNHHSVFGDGVMVFDVDSTYVDDETYDDWADFHQSQADRLRDAGFDDAADFYDRAILDAGS